jgi:hypothetical protein
MNEQTAIPTIGTTTMSAFSAAERSALQALRIRYRHGRGLLSPSELARLRFLRWLYWTGRLVP